MYCELWYVHLYGIILPCYNSSQIISEDLFEFISAYDKTDNKYKYFDSDGSQAATSFYRLLEHDLKNTAIQYLLVLIHDLLTVSIWSHT